MRGAAPQSLFVAIEPACEQVPPQAHTALAATVETRIAVARVFGGAREASHQPIVSSIERTGGIGITHP